MSNEKREKRKNWVEKLDRKTKIKPNMKNRVSTDEKNKKIFNLATSIRSRDRRRFSQNRENYPNRERVERVGTNELRHKCVLMSFYPPDGGS